MSTIARRSFFLFLPLFTGASACMPPAQVGVPTTISLPVNAASTCAEQCVRIGTHLDAVVLSGTTVGCVCRTSSVTVPHANADTGGAAGAVLIAEEARRQQEQAAQLQQQQQQNSSRRR